MSLRKTMNCPRCGESIRHPLSYRCHLRRCALALKCSYCNRQFTIESKCIEHMKKCKEITEAKDMLELEHAEQALEIYTNNVQKESCKQEKEQKTSVFSMLPHMPIIEENVLKRGKTLDEQMQKYYAQLNLKINSYLYLLIDPRKLILDKTKDTWSAFLASIFYIGSGIRPLKHLIYAKKNLNEQCKGNQVIVDMRTLKILEIWGAQRGVVLLTAMNASSLIEAKNYQFCMLTILWQFKSCELYNTQDLVAFGPTKNWNNSDRFAITVFILHTFFNAINQLTVREIKAENVSE